MEGKPLLGVSYQQDMTLYPEPNEIVLQFGHKDVVLDFFKGRKAKILSLQSGEPLYADGSYLSYDDSGTKKRLIKLSKKRKSSWKCLPAKDIEFKMPRSVLLWHGDTMTKPKNTLLSCQHSIWLSRIPNETSEIVDFAPLYYSVSPNT